MLLKITDNLKSVCLWSRAETCSEVSQSQTSILSMNITLAEGVNMEEVPTFHCVSQVVLSSADLVRGPTGVSRCLLKGETQCRQAP